MISEHARLLLLPEVRNRLLEIGPRERVVSNLEPLEAEAVLTRLMVQWVPKIASRENDAEWRASLLDSAITLCTSACGNDLRFFDALNVLYERCRLKACWYSDVGWAPFLTAYAGILQSQLDRLPSAQRTEDSGSGLNPYPAPRPRAWDGVSGGGKSALILADNAVAANRILRSVVKIRDMQVSVVICNNERISSLRFWASQCKSLVWVVSRRGATTSSPHHGSLHVSPPS